MGDIRSSETRQFPRRHIEINTTLVYNDLSIGECHTRDIGFGGAFIFTPTAAPPKNAHVKMLLIRRDKNIPLVINGSVVNTSSDGAAIKFWNINGEVSDALVDIIFSWNIPTSLSPIKRKRPPEIPEIYSLRN